MVDTSNEVAGDASQPHDCIGSARRMMVGGGSPRECSGLPALVAGSACRQSWWQRGLLARADSTCLRLGRRVWAPLHLRLQVPHPSRQHETMVEAVKNHNPDVSISLASSTTKGAPLPRCAGCAPQHTCGVHHHTSAMGGERDCTARPKGLHSPPWLSPPVGTSIPHRLASPLGRASRW